MSNAARDAARVLASIRTPARARASRKNGKLGGRPPATLSIRTAAGRVIAAGETLRDVCAELDAWKAAANRRAKLFVWRGSTNAGPYTPSRLLAVAQKSTI